MPLIQLARGLWSKFSGTENPFASPNGMEENLRLLDDHMGLYTVSVPQPVGTPMPVSPADGDGVLYTDGSYAVFNGGAWKAYPSRPGVKAIMYDGSDVWLSTASGGWLSMRVTAGHKVINVDCPPYNGDFSAAWGDIDAYGGVVLKLGKRSYNAVGIEDNNKPNVCIVGSGVPLYDRVEKRLVDGSGTIVMGSIYNHAKGFQLFNLGIDRGEWVRTNIAAGQYKDTFVNYEFGINANIRYGNIIVLQSEVVVEKPESYTHCILNERGTGVYQTGPVEVIDGYHGHVVKISNFFGHDTIARYQFADSVIIKSDAGALTKNVLLGNIIIDGDNARESAGVLLEAKTQEISGIRIGRIIASNANWAIAEAAATDAPIVDVQIGEISASAIAGNGGAEQAVVIGAHSIGYSIGMHQLNYCTKGGLCVKSGAINVDVGSGFSKSSNSGDGYLFNAPARHGKLYAGENSGWGVRNNSNTEMNAGDITCIANTLGGISAFIQIPIILQNSWTNASETFRVERHGRMVRISGQLSGGVAGTGYLWVKVAQLFNSHPVSDEYITCIGYDAEGAPKPLMSRVTYDGQVQIYGMGAQLVVGLCLSGTYLCQ